MAFTTGVVMGTIFGVALMFGWSYMMTYRRNKRIAKVLLKVIIASVTKNKEFLLT